MILLSVNDIIQATNAKIYLPEDTCLPEEINQVSIDTRQINDGALFIAFVGMNVDGHDYLSEAKRQGAVLALVEKEQSVAIPQLIVNSCEDALNLMAGASRKAFQGKVIAITGSSGKTSTKEMLVAILQQKSSVSFTQGNQNNALGLPLTLINFAKNSEFAVIEMGARNEDDIRALMAITEPDISVITNIGQAHIESFGSQEAIAKSKSEIYAFLKNTGCAVLNRDDAFYGFLNEQCVKVNETFTFSMSDTDADVFISDSVSDVNGSSFILHFRQCTQSVLLQQPGVHHVANALCAAACAIASGFDALSVISKGLNRFQTIDGRNREYQGFWSGVLIDDSYNANPASVKAAIDLLSLYDGRKILVLGDMLELGDDELLLHCNVVAYARNKGIDKVFLYGPLSSPAAQVFGEGAESFLDKEVLIKQLKKIVKQGDIVLLKGSRSLAMDTLVKPLLQEVSK